MTCPSCGAETRVVKSFDAEGPVMRKRRCVTCGYRGVTDETWRQTSPRVSTNGHQWPPVARNQPPVATNGHGGVGGGLSSGSVSGQENLYPLTGRSDARARTSRRANEYTAEFNKLWENTGKRGHKQLANRAWLKAGRPDPDIVSAKWVTYTASLETWRNPKDLSSWLNIEGHLQEYAPAAPARAGSTFAPLPGESFAERDTRLRRQAAALRAQENADADRVSLEALEKAGLRP